MHFAMEGNHISFFPSQVKLLYVGSITYNFIMNHAFEIFRWIEDNNGKEIWAHYCPRLADREAFGLMIPPHFKLELLKEAFLRLITISLDKNEWILSWSEEGAMELRWPDNVHWTHSKDIGKHRYIYESLFDQIKSGKQMNKWVVLITIGSPQSLVHPSSVRGWL